MSDQKLTELQNKLNYFFNDLSLLNKSLTHSSYANENPTESTSNERLEFLGDSLLGMTIALLIFNIKPDLSEGKMTKLRAELVCEKSLASIASELDLGKYLLLGRGEENGGGRSRPSILSDAFEAVLAAVYLDGGIEPVKTLISLLFNSRIIETRPDSSDYKTVLQEIIQLKPDQSLRYDLIEESGPDHDKSFIVEVKINNKTVGKGTGRSKKSAEQEAAKEAVSKLKVYQ